jgi:hypothetical protein
LALAISDGSKPLANHAHEGFARALCYGETQIDAYRVAGYRGGKASASRLAGRAEIIERVQALNRDLKAPSSVASLVVELEGARILALQADPPNCAAAVKATMLKAKLLGLGVSAKGRLSGKGARADMMGRLLPKLVAFLPNAGVRLI